MAHLALPLERMSCFAKIKLDWTVCLSSLLLETSRRNLLGEATLCGFSYLQSPEILGFSIASKTAQANNSCVFYLSCAWNILSPTLGSKSHLCPGRVDCRGVFRRKNLHSSILHPHPTDTESTETDGGARSFPTQHQVELPEPEGSEHVTFQQKSSQRGTSLIKDSLPSNFHSWVGPTLALLLLCTTQLGFQDDCLSFHPVFCKAPCPSAISHVPPRIPTFSPLYPSPFV